MTLRDEMRLVAVYDSDADARNAVRALEGAGADVAQVRLGDDRDHVAAIEGEMRSEAVSTVAGPGSVGPFTREMTRGALLGIVVGAAVGLLAALPVALIGIAGMSIAPSAALAEGIGMIVGATVGWIIGGAFAAKRDDEPLAAERGTTVAIPLSNDAEATLKATHPRRLDIVQPDGAPVSVVVEPEDKHVARDIARHMRSEDRSG